MKTSNKILLIFFINLLLIPVCLCIGYASLVKKGKYTTWQYESGERKHTIPLSGNYSVVKVEASAEEVLTCRFVYSDTLALRYTNHLAGDSVKMHLAGDTLIIRQTDRSKSSPNGANEVGVEVYLPNAVRIITDNARLEILKPDPAAAGRLDVLVTGTGSLNISTGIQFKQLFFTTNRGALFLEQGSQVQDLAIDISGGGSVQVEEDVQIGNLSGKMSDSTKINASWSTIQKLSAIK